MLKVELHAHTADDPHDSIPHSATELIDEAVALGYDALAITLHDRQLDINKLRPYAAERRLVLIPGIERTIQGKHVLLLNYETGTEDVRTFAAVAWSWRHTRSFRLKAVSGSISIDIKIFSMPSSATPCSPGWPTLMGLPGAGLGVRASH